MLFGLLKTALAKLFNDCLKVVPDSPAYVQKCFIF